jgi:glycerol kinase
VAGPLVMGIDAGTTGLTVVLYDRDLQVRDRADADFPQHFPQPGWVEHDAQEVAETLIRLVRAVAARAPGPITAVGVANQRETVVPIDAETGRPLHRAIVWQCRRTAGDCEARRRRGEEERIRSRTGLLLDPYFSATKMRWLLDRVPAVAGARARRTLRFLTIDAWVLHVLSGGRSLATDATNASRTLLFDLEARSYDADLVARFGLEAWMLPPVQPPAGRFGETDPARTGFRAPVTAMLGDQQAALVGHGALGPGQAKNTYGTGCFLLAVAGGSRPPLSPGILQTLGVDARGSLQYVVEGSVFTAGAAVQWLRDGLGLIADAAETETLAASLPGNDGVYLVPAFTGLGAPHWDPRARGLIAGLTRGTTKAHLARATLEAIAYQVHDLVQAIEAASAATLTELRVDGGGSRNRWLMEFQAGVLSRPVLAARDADMTSRGAAALALLGAGHVDSLLDLPAGPEAERYDPPSLDREALLAGWRAAVARAGLRP